MQALFFKKISVSKWQVRLRSFGQVSLYFATFSWFDDVSLSIFRPDLAFLLPFFVSFSLIVFRLFLKLSRNTYKGISCK
jgi:hypothetical protein